MLFLSVTGASTGLTPIPTLTTQLPLTLTVEEDLRVEAVFDYGLLDSLKFVPHGVFTMGDATSRNGAMKPAHDIEVSSYYMTEHEVTKAPGTRFTTGP